MAKVRGVRFSEQEDALIEEFLNRNPLIDFTTLAKMAILGFVRNPQMNLEPATGRRKGGKDASAAN